MTPTPEAIEAALMAYYRSRAADAEGLDYAGIERRAMSRALAAADTAMEAAGWVRVPSCCGVSPAASRQ